MDASYLLLAAKYIRRQAKQLAEQLDGVCKAEDIEFVHRARVASRRLRAALRMFRPCFGGKSAKKWRKQIRRVTSELGDARDIDVQIEFLCGAMHSVTQPACYPGIARLLVQLEHRRGLLQTSVIKAVERLRTGGALEEMQAAAKKILSDPKSDEVCARSPCAIHETGRHIRRRLKKLLRHEESLGDPEDQSQHHAMRIAAKRLRYTLEIANPVCDKRLDPMVEAVKRVQTLLGGIHDCDIWLERLEAFAASERENVLALFGSAGPFGRLSVGIEHLRQDRATHRQQTFHELVAYWEELKRQRLWENLVSVVAGPAETVAAAAETAAQPAEPAEVTVSAAAPPAPALLPAATELAPHWHKLGTAEVRDEAAYRLRSNLEPLREPLRPALSEPPRPTRILLPPAAVQTAQG